jgi:hypothetical protein
MNAPRAPAPKQVKIFFIVILLLFQLQITDNFDHK